MMDEAARAAFINSQTACMLAELEAMKRLNKMHDIIGRPPAHLPYEFEALADRFGLGHNTVVQYLLGQ